MSEIERNLGKLTIGLEVVILSDGVKLLVGIRVDDLVTPVVVRLVLVLDPLS